ncbi:hypothetical protein ACWGNA_07160 [Brucella cytisi]|jgi:hypothetical protein
MAYKRICRVLVMLLVSLVVPTAIIGGPIILLFFVSRRFAM